MGDELIVGGYGRLASANLPAFTGTSWEDHLQAWIDAEQDVTSARWRQAAVAHSLEVHYGEASVEQFAAQIGIAARRVWEYRTVYRIALAHHCERPQNLDFSHYVIASTATNPHDYLDRAADQQLSTRALRRLIVAEQAPPIDQTLPPISDDPRVMAAWGQVRGSLAGLQAAAPHLSDLITGYLTELEYEISCPPATVREAILTAINQGVDTIDQIAKRLGRHRDHVRVWLNRLEELGEIEHDERRVGARGPAETWWRLKE